MLLGGEEEEDRSLKSGTKPERLFLLSIARIPAMAIGLPVVAGFLSGARTHNVVRGRWHQSLILPALYPPRQVFPIVWTGLYVGMGWASHIAAEAVDAGRPGAVVGLALYHVQLGLNLAWTPLFFGKKKIGTALIDLLALTGTTFYMTSVLHEATDGATSYVLIPYCAWLSFATYLNGSIWWYNRGRDRKSVV